MTIIHAMAILPRAAGAALCQRLGAMPAVVVTGTRQTGKSTLVEQPVPGRRRYRSLGVTARRRSGSRCTSSSVTGSAPSSFLRAGSANLLLMRQVSETLVGRASYLTLWPMTRREQLGQGRTGLWDELLAAPDEEWRDILAAEPDEAVDWRALALRGGFPTPAVEMRKAGDRSVWMDGYVRTYLERDLQERASISALPCSRRRGGR